MTDPAPLAIGYEAEIFVERDAGGAPARVVKRYSFAHPAVTWLNQRLAQWYDPAAGLPVAQHEWAAYALLAPHGFVPDALERREDAIVLGWGGEPLAADAAIAPEDYRRQAEAILAAFAALGFRHNDLLRRNVLVGAGRVRIIDFTMAEFGDVRFTHELPDPGWARAGQDEQLLGHLDALRPRRRSPLRFLHRSKTREA